MVVYRGAELDGAVSLRPFHSSRLPLSVSDGRLVALHANAWSTSSVFRTQTLRPA